MLYVSRDKLEENIWLTLITSKDIGMQTCSNPQCMKQTPETDLRKASNSRGEGSLNIKMERGAGQKFS